MSKSADFENDFLKLVFNGVAIAGIADNAAAGANTQLYWALHTDDPGEGGNQTTNEVAYAGYARVPLNRDGTGFTVVNNKVYPAVAIEFPEMTGGASGEATWGSVGLVANGVSKILYRGALTPSVHYDLGSVPRIRTTSYIQEL